VQRGTWQIDGYKWQSALLARLPDNMALDALDVELKEDGTGVHFTAKGKYYVLN
jgi:cytochrome oxidase assembly protein ShyY1